MIKFFTIAVLPLFFSACLVSPGTNTGNPGTTNPNAGIDVNSVRYLTEKICAKIKSCNPSVNTSTCGTQIYFLSGYTTELGAISTIYDKMSDLAGAVMNDAVEENSTNYTNCVSAMDGLGCSDSILQNAYSNSSPTDYSLTNQLFRASTSCRQIY